MRPISQELYGIPRERVIGSATALAYTSDDRGGTITHTPAPDYLDDGPEKPIRIWSERAAGRCSPPGTPTATSRCSTSPGTPTARTCALLVLHDDAEREFDYTTGAEQALARGRARRLDGRERQGRLGHGVLTGAPGQLFSRPPRPRPTSATPISTASPSAILPPSRLSHALKRLTPPAVFSGASV